MMGFSATHQPPSRARRVPWEVVCAIRRDWAAVLAALGVLPDAGWVPPSGMCSELRAAGLPLAADLARRHGVSAPRVSEILRGRQYQYPPEQAAAIKAARVSATKRARRGEA